MSGILRCGIETSLCGRASSLPCVHVRFQYRKLTATDLECVQFVVTDGVGGPVVLRRRIDPGVGARLWTCLNGLGS